MATPSRSSRTASRSPPANDQSITDPGYTGLDITDYDGQGAPGDGQCDDWVAGTFTSQGDTEAPSAPGTLTATAPSPTTINLSWGAATDNIGVTGYLVERCQGAGCSSFAQIGSPATTSFSDTTVTATTSYSYRVRATDAAANLGGFSNISTIATPAAPDTQAPTAPADLAATAMSGTTVNLTWTGRRPTTSR